MTLRCKCLSVSLAACRVRSTICRPRWSGHSTARRNGRYLLWSDVVGDETGRALLCTSKAQNGSPGEAVTGRWLVAVAGRHGVKLPSSAVVVFGHVH